MARKGAALGTASILGLIVAASAAFAASIPAKDRPLHLLNRLAYGPSPGDLKHVRQIGVERYIQEQLHPESIPVPEELRKQIDSLKTLRLTPVESAREYGPKNMGKKPDPEAQKAQRQRANIIMEEAVQARFLRAVEGSRQLKEQMVDFWFNHFNVFAGKDQDHLWTGSFEEEAIRPHAMGRFRDLLEATAKHPAMLVYLDNWLNTAPNSPGARGKQDGLNENYARELMELHTLGVDGGYTQQDVVALARILTGWGIVRPRQMMMAGGAQMDLAGGMGGIGGWFFPRRRLMRVQRIADMSTINDGTGFFFDAQRHDFGEKVFLGHTIEGSGAAEVEEALDILANSPATAHHLSYQLTQYFVADNPPDSLVRRLTARYLETDGNITAMLGTLFHSPEFWDQKYYHAKFKTPYQYVVSAVRAAGVPMRNSRPLFGTLQQLGQPLYMCLTPDGYKNTQEAWLNPDAMMWRLTFATALGSARLPVSAEPRWTNEAPRMTPAMASESVTPVRAETSEPSIRPQPVSFVALADTLGNRSTAETAKAIREAPEELKAAIILGSPEFMKH